MESIREMPVALAFGILFCIVMARANATYWIGRGAIGGWRRHPKYAHHLDARSVKRAKGMVHRFGPLAVPLSFLTVGVQTVVNLMAGAGRMPLVRYLPAVAVGSLIWAGVYTVAGVALLDVILRLVH